jgi:hypothetical protein
VQRERKDFGLLKKISWDKAWGTLYIGAPRFGLTGDFLALVQQTVISSEATLFVVHINRTGLIFTDGLGEICARVWKARSSPSPASLHLIAIKALRGFEISPRLSGRGPISGRKHSHDRPEVLDDRFRGAVYAKYTGWPLCGKMRDGIRRA